MADPQKVTPPVTPTTSISMTADDLMKVIASLRQDPEEQAKLLARAGQLAQSVNPSNPSAPQVSYRNPYGERDHPKPKLKTTFTWNDGIPFEQDQETWELIELLNAMEPGQYFINATDGTKMSFKVTEHRDDLGGLNRVNITLKCDNEHKDRLRGMTEMIREAMGDKVKDILTMKQHESRAAMGVYPGDLVAA